MYIPVRRNDVSKPYFTFPKSYFVKADRGNVLSKSYQKFQNHSLSHFFSTLLSCYSALQVYLSEAKECNQKIYLPFGQITSG
jgi:hypothetical protein